MSEIAPELRGVLEGIQEPAILLSLEYRILVANSAYQRLYGREEEICGRLCFEVSHHNTRPCHEEGEPCPLKLAKVNGESQRVLHIHHSPRGDEHVEVEGKPVFGDDGDLHYLVEIVRRSTAASPQVGGRGLVGRSPAFNRMLSLVQRVAPSETPVLLLGESGTGKELVAKAVHDQSPRRDAAFVPVECSGLSESLFESELFGHERGAFTGAHVAKEGLVEVACGGTLFLDEIGDIPLGLQVKLLRLLETGTYRRVGSVEPRQADFRLISATHRDLKQMVDEGRFRQDLYYRISVFPVQLPSLSERREDLPILAETLLKRIRGVAGVTISREALDLLARYEFPGNVRELRNILERSALMADAGVIRPEHLPVELQPTLPVVVGDQKSIVPLDEMERRYLARVVREFTGHRSELARQLGISERTLFRKLQKLQDRG